MSSQLEELLTLKRELGIERANARRASLRYEERLAAAVTGCVRALWFYDLSEPDRLLMRTAIKKASG